MFRVWFKSVALVSFFPFFFPLWKHSFQKRDFICCLTRVQNSETGVAFPAGERDVLPLQPPRATWPGQWVRSRGPV